MKSEPAWGDVDVVNLAEDTEKAKDTGETKDIGEEKDVEDVEDVEYVENIEIVEDIVDTEVVEGDEELEWEDTHAEAVVEVLDARLEITSPFDLAIICVQIGWNVTGREYREYRECIECIETAIEQQWERCDIRNAWPTFLSEW